MVKILKKGIDVPLKLAYYCIINLIQQNLERVGTVIKNSIRLNGAQSISGRRGVRK